MIEPLSNTKKKILETALTLFKEKGYENVSISEISDAAGVSTSTFYYQFTSKTVLFDYLTHWDALPNEVMVKMLTLNSPVEKLWLMHQAYATMGERLGPDLYSQFFKMRLTRHQSYKTDVNSEHTVLLTTELIQAAQDLGEIKNPKPAPVLAESVMHLLVGICHSWCVEKGSFDLREKIRQGVEAFYNMGS
jgi:AcrR family transcriptional regulator